MICFPLDNTEYTAEALGAYMATRTRGVFSADGNLEATSNGNMLVTVSPGIAWLCKEQYWGTVCYQKDFAVLTVPQAESQFPRIDAVCCRLDKNANTAEILIKRGEAKSNPTIPEIERSTDVDEIYLATIAVPAGATTISAADITDQRLNEHYCGLMRDGVTGIPTATLEAQAKELIQRLEQLLSDVESGTETMLKDIYDQDNDGFVDNGVVPFVHTKNGTVHNFAGSEKMPGGIVNGNAKITAAFVSGDSFSVNGNPVPAYTGNEETAELFEGKWMPFTYDGTQINFKSGGGRGKVPFETIAVASESALPSNAPDGQIAVISGTPVTSSYITSWRHMPTTEGQVVTTCSTLFNVDTLATFAYYKSHRINLTLMNAYQCENGVAVPKKAFLRKTGTWVPLETVIYDRGVLSYGASKVSADSGSEVWADRIAMYLHAPTAQVYMGSMLISPGVDLTPLNTLYFDVSFVTWQSPVKNYAALTVGVRATSSSNMAAYATTQQEKQHTIAVDVSNLSGSYYIGANIRAYQGTTSYHITKIWGE